MLITFGDSWVYGVGAGYTFKNQLVGGPNRLTVEWGQNPIPRPMDEYEKSVKRH